MDIIFLTHREDRAALSLKKKIEHQYGWRCIVPTYKQKEQLE